MEEVKSIQITIPKGYEIDKDKSTFENIVFKKKVARWRDIIDRKIKTVYKTCWNGAVDGFGDKLHNDCMNSFPKKEYAESVLALAKMSQIIDNDERFGGIISDHEWKDPLLNKYIITNCGSKILKGGSSITKQILAFHTEKQRDLFIEENTDLLKQYFMID